MAFRFPSFIKPTITRCLWALPVIGALILVTVFWRSIQTIAVLGTDSIRWYFPYTAHNLGYLSLHDGEDAFKGAISDLESRLFSPDSGLNYNDKKLLSRLYFYSNRIEKAETLYRELSILHPDDAELIKSFGVLLMSHGRIVNCPNQMDVCQYPFVHPHVEPESTHRALELFIRADELAPSWSTKWLIHLAKVAISRQTNAYQSLDKAPADLLVPELNEDASRAGVAKVDLGRGNLVADMDGDGWLDIITASTNYPLGYFKGIGNRSFVDRTVESGLARINNGFILAAADIDNDGDLDLYVSRNAFYGQMPNIMLRNDGTGHFTDITAFSGTGNSGAGFVAAFADYDTDGDLDLFVANMSSPLPYGGGAIADIYGRHSNVLYRNTGNGKFEDVTEQAGLLNVDSHLGATWGDIDEDGDPDLYVTTFFGFNHLYINQGDGTFVDRAKERGVTAPWASFSGWFFDYDNDSHLDLLVPANMPTELVAQYLVSREEPKLTQTMRLFKGDGQGYFVDVTEQAGLQIAASAMGANWGDINNDGYADFYLGTGGPPMEQLEPNLLLLNRGDGTFWNASDATRSGFLQKGHGVAFADLDGDGWQDLYVSLGGAWLVDTARNVLLWNNPPANLEVGHFLKVLLRGRQSNSHGVGARITVKIGQREIVREIGSGGGFGKNPLMAHFGVKNSHQIDELQVIWPGRVTVQTFRNIPANQTVIIDEGNSCLIFLPSTVRTADKPEQPYLSGSVPVRDSGRLDCAEVTTGGA